MVKVVEKVVAALEAESVDDESVNDDGAAEPVLVDNNDEEAVPVTASVLLIAVTDSLE